MPKKGFNVYIYIYLYTSERVALMRTNIVIDDDLMADALKVTGLKTKREAVELGLKTLIKINKQESIRRFRGKLHWEGDLDEMGRES
jgi:Arc/MetJ family transcription regulator